MRFRYYQRSHMTDPDNAGRIFSSFDLQEISMDGSSPNRQPNISIDELASEITELAGHLNVTMRL